MPIEIGAADAYAVIGENIGRAVRFRAALGPEPYDGEVGRAAADIGDQRDFLGPDLTFVVKRRCDRLELK